MQERQENYSNNRNEVAETATMTYLTNLLNTLFLHYKERINKVLCNIAYISENARCLSLINTLKK